MLFSWVFSGGKGKSKSVVGWKDYFHWMDTIQNVKKDCIYVEIFPALTAVIYCFIKWSSSCILNLNSISLTVYASKIHYIIFFNSSFKLSFEKQSCEWRVCQLCSHLYIWIQIHLLTVYAKIIHYISFWFHLQAELGGAEARMVRISITYEHKYTYWLCMLKNPLYQFFYSCFKMSLILRGEYSAGGTNIYLVSHRWNYLEFSID